MPPGPESGWVSTRRAKRKHNWLMTWLYVDTFGSFIGFAAGLPLLIKNNFEAQGYQATTSAWIDPFIGALMRWAGGWLSDKIGGARVTLLSFVGMAAALVVVIFALPSDGDQGSFWAFFPGFLAAFAFSGLGNGSTFRQIPVIFRDRHMREAEGMGPEVQAATLKQSEMEAGAVTGFYASCLALCWWFCARKGAEAPS
ncbi:hypothetical protein [Streptomyces sp. NRRL F-2580]|uniref:hypothetical protein n=1 Tax=Streptomyces sp. NRRL F-2580 TaxID=1463841 RepID=UPI0004CB4FAB|nr:hypothetical protein [Streptomyces sp. NRRL F-2580]